MEEKRRLTGYTYTPLEQAQKDLALRQAARDFPDVPLLWREWAYDYVTKEVGEKVFSKKVEMGHYEKNPSGKEKCRAPTELS